MGKNISVIVGTVAKRIEYFAKRIEYFIKIIDLLRKISLTKLND